jgi:hypothetical protein
VAEVLSGLSLTPPHETLKLNLKFWAKIRDPRPLEYNAERIFSILTCRGDYRWGSGLDDWIY